MTTEPEQVDELPPAGWPRPAGHLGKWPPACGTCGHRHPPGVRCAGHPWSDDCPYDAGPNCPDLVPVDDGDAAAAGEFEVDPRDQRPPVDVVTHVAVCHACTADQPPAAAGWSAIPFATAEQRDRWASRHADTRGHRVTLAEQRPGVGSTVVGYADPDPARVPGPVADPLLAFVVPGGSADPSLMCRVPNRAGAVWLAYAAHACLLGHQGSSGVPEPHRVMFIGRVSPPTEHAGWLVRIDGVLGASNARYGAAIGSRHQVLADMTLPDVESAVEARIDETYHFGRHTFSVILVTDAPLGDPPDPHADATLRAAAAPRCCEQHGTSCEAPSDLCCANCGEAAHPAHVPGTRCVHADAGVASPAGVPRAGG